MEETYPEQILPQKHFLHIMDVKGLLNCYPTLAVSRRVKGNRDDAFVCFNGERQLKDSLMGQVANMSLNLLGGLFVNDKHLKFCPKQDVMDWTGEDVCKDGLEGKFSIEECCFPVYFLVKDIWNYPFSVPYSFQKEKEAMLFISSKPEGDIEKKYVDKFNKQESILLKTHAVLKHAPTNFNYWHCVLDSYPSLSSEDAIPTNYKNSANRIIKQFRSNLIKNFLKEETKVSYAISPSHYCA